MAAVSSTGSPSTKSTPTAAVAKPATETTTPRNHGQDQKNSNQNAASFYDKTSSSHSSTSLTHSQQQRLSQQLALKTPEQTTTMPSATEQTLSPRVPCVDEGHKVDVVSFAHMTGNFNFELNSENAEEGVTSMEEDLTDSFRESRKDITMKEKKMMCSKTSAHNSSCDKSGGIDDTSNRREGASSPLENGGNPKGVASQKSISPPIAYRSEANRYHDQKKPTILHGIRNALNACGEEISGEPHSSQYVVKWVLIKEILHKAVRGDLKAARELFMTEYDTNALPTYGESASFHSSATNSMQDMFEDESQIHRLTSWGTYTTSCTYDSIRVDGANNIVKEPARVVFDDQGNIIDPVLFEKAQKQHEQRMIIIGRKRKVKFDYPPISSLREYPRPKPDEVENMFFSEYELEQIEDDRYSTMSADDVEIVAISTSNDSDQRSSTNNSVDFSQRSAGKDTNFKNYVATPHRGRRSKRFGFEEGTAEASGNGNSRIRAPTPGPATSRRGRSPSAERGHRKSGNGTATARGYRSQQAARGRSTSDEINPNVDHRHQSQRMLKSVQIYLRERSLNY